MSIALSVLPLVATAHTENSMQSETRMYDVGASVRVSRGSLAGVTGVVVETRDHGSRSVISIDFWVYGVKVVLSSDDLEMVRKNRRFALN
jgi:hypothetical protein